MNFVGRTQYLSRLADHFTPGSHGRAVIVSGRRRVGKSRLVQEFCDRSGLPYAVFQASRGRDPAAERRDFLSVLTQSGMAGSALLDGVEVGDWLQALRSIAVALAPPTQPVAAGIVVLDEVPWLIEQDPEFEGALQTAWDRHLSALPLRLLLVGSDAGVMTGLQSPRRAFFGRAVPMTVEPLNVADVATMTNLNAADAIDATLVTGGFPELVREWRGDESVSDHLGRALATPLSPLLVSGELSLLGEVPDISQARAVLEAVGNGERTFARIAAAAGRGGVLPSGSLSPLLRALVDKRLLAVEGPLSTMADTKNRRYRVADSYLRFWLAFLRRGIPFVERGRGDVVHRQIENGWSSWRGRAVEPLVRESLLRLVTDSVYQDTAAVGGWWNRQNNPEIDLVGADRAEVAGRVTFVGSIKWHDGAPFDSRDRDELVRGMLAVPGVGVDTALVAVSRSGFRPGLDLATTWGPDELRDAWVS